MSRAEQMGPRVTTSASVTLPGIKEGGRYVFLAYNGELGTLEGRVLNTPEPVTPPAPPNPAVGIPGATVKASGWPFVATSGVSPVQGYYVTLLPVGGASVTASVEGTSLQGSGSTTVPSPSGPAPTTATLDISLQGTVTSATTTPSSGAVNVDITAPLSIDALVPLDAATVTESTIRLVRIVPANDPLYPNPPPPPGTEVTEVTPVRLVLSGSARKVSVLPLSKLRFDSTYRLGLAPNASLRDTTGAPVLLSPATFQTKQDIPPVYDLTKIVFSYPDAQGDIRVTAPAGTLAPGTQVLIINAGNGMVASFTADNDGAVGLLVPARFQGSIDDQPFITVTDPLGNSQSITKSEYRDEATGETAVGPGGGKVRATCASNNIQDAACQPELILPEGILTKGLKLKVSLVSPADHDTLFPPDLGPGGTPDPSAPKPLENILPGTHLGSIIKIASNSQAQAFQGEGDLRFPVPDFTLVPPAERPQDPAKALYSIHRVTKLCRTNPVVPAPSYVPSNCAPQDQVTTFEVIDDARYVPAQGTEPARIETKSQPFIGWAYQGSGDNYYTLNWSAHHPGLITGNVRTQTFTEGSPNPVTTAVPGAFVTGVTLSGRVVTTNETGGRSYAVSQANGTFVLYDSMFGDTTAIVAATTAGSPIPSTDIRVNCDPRPVDADPRVACAYAQQVTNDYVTYRRQAHVTLSFPAVRQAPSPLIVVDVLKEDGTPTGGVVTEGTPVVIQFRGPVGGRPFDIRAAEINGETVVVMKSGPGWVVSPNFVPTRSGSYQIRTTALQAFVPPIPVSGSFRAITAGGGIDTDNQNPPRILTARTYPKNGATGVSLTTAIEMAFTEPVTNVMASVSLKENGNTVPVLISAVSAEGTVIPDLSTYEPPTGVTSITVTPRVGFKFKSRYELEVATTLKDLDRAAPIPPATQGVPAPKFLELTFLTTFETFGPEEIPQEGSGVTTSMGMYVQGDYAYSASTLSAGLGQSYLRTYDISDPTQPKLEYSSVHPGRAMSLSGDATYVALVTGPLAQSRPTNLHLYDIGQTPAAPKWVGSASFTNSALDGFVRQIVLKNEKIYAATGRKGLQIMTTTNVTGGHIECCTPNYFAMIQNLNTDGTGFNSSAVTATIPIPGLSPSQVFFTSLDVLQTANGPLIGTTGRFGFALAPELENAVRFQGDLTKDGFRLSSPTGVTVNPPNFTSHALVKAADIQGQLRFLLAGPMTTPGGYRNGVMVIDPSNPTAPVVVGAAELASGLSPDAIAAATVQSIVVRGDFAYIGMSQPGYNTATSTFTSKPITAIVSLADEAHPQYAGQIEGVGGHLALGLEGSLLMGQLGSTFGNAATHGGVHNAALETITYIKRVTENPVILDIDRKSIETQEVEAVVFPPLSAEDRPGAIAKLQLVNAQTQAVVRTLAATLDATSVAKVTIPENQTHPTSGLRARLMVNDGKPDAPRATAKAIEVDQFEVSLSYGDPQLPEGDTRVISEDETTSDYPKAIVEATSAALSARHEAALARGEEAPTKTIDWVISQVPGHVEPASTQSADGVFETTLEAPPVVGSVRQVRALMNGHVLGDTESVEIEPGEPAQITITASKTALPADDKSQAVLTVEIRDAAGNLVADGTPVIWEKGEGADGAFIEALEGTTNGRATVKYQAGVNPGPAVINLHAGEAVGSQTIQQAGLGVLLSVPPSRSYHDKTMLPLTIQVTSTAGPVADGAPIGWFSTSGRVTETQPLTGGTALANWDPTQTTWRPKIDFVVTVGQGRAQKRMLWSRQVASNVTPQGTRNARALLGVNEASTEAMQPPAASEPHIATVFPAFVAGDLTQDGTVPFEKADGTTENVFVKATATYQAFGLVPGERVSVNLGSNRAPNVAPIVHYTGDEKEGTTIPDLTGVHDGQATSGVTVIQSGYKGGAFSFGASGIGNVSSSGITIAHDPEFSFSGGFMVQTAVRPPALVGVRDTGGGSGGGSTAAVSRVLIRKGPGFALALVETGVANELKARFTIQTSVGPEYVQTSQPIPREQWTLVTGKYENGRIYVGIENALESSLISGPPVLGTEAIEIGPGFTGDLDEIRIFDLTKQPLAKFANGQSALSFVADASGSFEAPILSTGALAALRVARYFRNLHEGQRLARDGIPRFARALHSELQDPGLTADTELAYASIEATTYWEDTADSATTSVGYVSAKTMAFFAKMGQRIITGPGGAGDNEDPTSLANIAGDLFGSFFLAPLTMARDAVNSTDRLVRGSANGQDGLDLALGVVTVGSSLVKGKAGAFLQLGKLAKALPSGSKSAKVVARLMTAEAAIVAGASGVSRVKKIVEVVNLSATAATLVGGIVDVVGDDEAIGHFNTTLENVSGASVQGVLEELDSFHRAFGGIELANLFGATGTPFAPGAPAQGESTVRYWKVVRESLRGMKVGKKVLNEAGLARRAKGLEKRVKKYFGEEADQIFKDVEEIARRYGAQDSNGQIEELKRKGLHRLVRALGSKNEYARLGAIKVLKYTKENPGVGKAEYERFVRVAFADGKTVVRYVDLITDRGLWVEVKNWLKWTKFPPSLQDFRRQRALRGAEWQFLTSIVQLKQEAATNLRMVFTTGPDGVEKFSGAIRAHFLKLVDDPWLKRKMVAPGDAGAERIYRDTVKALKDEMGKNGVIEFR